MQIRALPRLLALTLVGLTACRTVPSEEDLHAQLVAATRSFESAERALDAERVLAHLDTEFEMFQDGVRVDRARIEDQIRSSLPALQHFGGAWEDLRVVVLGPRAGLSSFRFRDEIVDQEGVASTSRGPTTLVWRRGSAGWRIVFAHADHERDD